MIYSLFTVVIIFLGMVFFDIYNERMIANNYSTISLKKFKEKEFSYSNGKSTNHTKIAKIHISGAVKNPGFYEIKSGISLKQIVEEIVILRSDANISNLNLNKKIYHEDKLIIPHK